MNYYEPWTLENVPEDFANAVDAVKCALSDGFKERSWIHCRWRNLSGASWMCCGTSPLEVTKEYRLVDRPEMPRSLLPWLQKSPAERLLSGEQVDVVPLAPTEFDRLEAVWNAHPKHLRRYGFPGRFIPACGLATLRAMRDHRIRTDNHKWLALLLPAPGTAGSPVPGPKQPGPKQPEPKKETPMNPIPIKKNATLVNGLTPDAYSARQRSDMLGNIETAVKQLEALEFKTQETKDEIAALRRNAKELIEIFDADYADRKAAKEQRD